MWYYDMTDVSGWIDVAKSKKNKECYVSLFVF